MWNERSHPEGLPKEVIIIFYENIFSSTIDTLSGVIIITYGHIKHEIRRKTINAFDEIFRLLCLKFNFRLGETALGQNIEHRGLSTKL